MTMTRLSGLKRFFNKFTVIMLCIAAMTFPRITASQFTNPINLAEDYSKTSDVKNETEEQKLIFVSQAYKSPQLLHEFPLYDDKMTESQTNKVLPTAYEREPTLEEYDVESRWFPEDSYAGKLKKLGLLAQSIKRTISGEKYKLIERLNRLLPHVLRFTTNKNESDDRKLQKNDVHKRTKRSSWGDFWNDYEYYDYVDYCDDPPCPTWSEWYGSGICNATCGGGKRLMVRYCNNSKTDEFQGGCSGETTRLEDCNMKPCPSWTKWLSAGKCSATCGKGIMKYTRKCTLFNKKSQGCLGANNEFRVCSGSNSCPPQWSTWSRFASCTKSCGIGGVQFRRRICIVDGKPARTSKTPCAGNAVQQRKCQNLPSCKPQYSQWTSWSRCTAMTCDATGIQSRTRSCLGRNGRVLSKYRMNCLPDLLSETQRCRSESCTTACAIVLSDLPRTNSTMMARLYTTPLPTWSQWTEWNACSVTCGLSGKQTRNRMCFGVQVEKKNNNVILKENKLCEGKSIEKRECHYNVGCPRWESWQKWGTCTKTCGAAGRRKRSRNCVMDIYERFNVGEVEETTAIISKADVIEGSGEGSAEGSGFADEWENLPKATMYSGGTDLNRKQRNISRKAYLNAHWCQGGESNINMIGTCNEHPCPPKWSRWSAWSKCPVTCGKSQMQRTRRCIGKGACFGNKIEFRACFATPCWGEWSPFTPCTTSCGSGTRTRARKCKGTTPDIPGYRQCKGSNKETKKCNTQSCPKWGTWSAWGNCSAPCDGGTRMRTRDCVQGFCRGRNIEIGSCNYQPCPYWDQWSTFSCCSVSCDDGVKTRNRRCRHGKQGVPGCIGPTMDTKPCNPSPCNVTVKSPLSHSQCGIKPIEKDNKPILRIFKGKLSQDHEWPWQSSWQHYTCIAGVYDCKWEHLCGATLLGSKWVVTAGHCIEEWMYRVVHDDPGEEWSVVIGMTKLYKDGDRYFVRRVFLHPKYLYKGVPQNDIALLKLRKPVPLAENTMPACLPEHHVPQKNEECYITGWGKQSPRSQLSNQLLHADLPIMDFNECQKLGDVYKNYLKKASHMCAGDIHNDEGADSCRGDSGGPMVCIRPDGKWYLAGITSFGFKECGTKGHAGIYVPMNEYENWVRDTIKKFSHNGC